MKWTAAHLQRFLGNFPPVLLGLLHSGELSFRLAQFSGGQVRLAAYAVEYSLARCIQMARTSRWQRVVVQGITAIK